MTESEFYYESIRFADLVQRVLAWEPKAAQDVATYLRDTTGKPVYAPDVLTWINDDDGEKRFQENSDYVPAGEVWNGTVREVMGIWITLKDNKPYFQWRRLEKATGEPYRWRS
jgi:hypothetical protein